MLEFSACLIFGIGVCTILRALYMFFIVLMDGYKPYYTIETHDTKYFRVVYNGFGSAHTIRDRLHTLEEAKEVISVHKEKLANEGKIVYREDARYVE